MKKKYKEGSLFWSWGAFVFLSVNFFTGALISQSATLLEGIIAIFLGFIFLSLATFPVVEISVVNTLNYSKAIKSYVNNRILRNALIILVPLINIGWYSIQVGIVVSILCNTFPILSNYLLTVSIINIKSLENIDKVTKLAGLQGILRYAFVPVMLKCCEENTCSGFQWRDEWVEEAYEDITD